MNWHILNLFFPGLGRVNPFDSQLDPFFKIFYLFLIRPYKIEIKSLKMLN